MWLKHVDVPEGLLETLKNMKNDNPDCHLALDIISIGSQENKYQTKTRCDSSVEVRQVL